MCNIAGYNGSRQASPILLEMLRRQQCFDGEQSCGIATIHEGKLHWRKVVGNVDTLIRETDALSLPGTIGIAHTRDAGAPGTWELAHPYLSMDEETAVVSNGTTPDDGYTPRRNAAVQRLGDAGVVFRTATPDPASTWPRLKNGLAVGTGEVRVHLIDYYVKQGKSVEEALALTASDLYTDNVLLALHRGHPDTIFGIRTVRPMKALLAKGETYLATTAFGFPAEVQGERLSLPLLRACSIGKGTLTVSDKRVEVEPVCAPTLRLLAVAYHAAEQALTGREKDPVCIDGPEGIGAILRKAVEREWTERHTYVPAADVTYTVLEQLEAEGRLHRVVREVPYRLGTRRRYFVWID